MIPQSASASLLSSPFGSSDVSRDVSRHGPSVLSQQQGLAITAEDHDGEVAEAEEDHEERGAAGSGVGSAAELSGGAGSNELTAAQAMAAAWTGSGVGHSVAGARSNVSAATRSAGSERWAARQLPVDAPTSTADVRPSSGERLQEVGGGIGTAGNASASLALTVSVPSEDEAWGDTTAKADGGGAGFAGTPQSTGRGKGDSDVFDAPTEEEGAGAWARVGDAASLVQVVSERPPLGTGVRADPASHQHKRPVGAALGSVSLHVFQPVIYRQKPELGDCSPC